VLEDLYEALVLRQRLSSTILVTPTNSLSSAATLVRFNYFHPRLTVAAKRWIERVGRGGHNSGQEQRKRCGALSGPDEVLLVVEQDVTSLLSIALYTREAFVHSSILARCAARNCPL